jgi:peroxiredoxin
MENNNANWVDARLTSLDPGGAWSPDPTSAFARLQARGHHRRGRARLWTWSAAAATASLCLMAFPAPRAAAQYCLSCSVALWQNLATTKIAHVTLTPVNARKLAPDFTLNDFSGTPVRLSSYKGRVVLLNFWATWCGGCKVEIPWFIDFERAYASSGLTVLGVSFDDDGWKLVRPFVAAKHINYPVMIADSHIAGLYGGVGALPVTFIIDKSGRIASTHLGVVAKIDYQTEIEKLLRE